VPAVTAKPTGRRSQRVRAATTATTAAQGSARSGMFGKGKKAVGFVVNHSPATATPKPRDVFDDSAFFETPGKSLTRKSAPRKHKRKAQSAPTDAEAQGPPSAATPLSHSPAPDQVEHT
jgi:hypothetical protein